MTTTEAIKILRSHNAWRRGGDEHIGFGEGECEMAGAAALGVAIDTLCDLAEVRVSAQAITIRPTA